MSHRYADPCLLPFLAVKALRAVAARDHSTARTLWARSKGEHNRNQLRRSRRMGVASLRLEACSRDMSAEVRA
ncbi:rhodopsin [Stenotrophomonas maltophilia]|uniref:rhodopsin n=1 Tax=Stenotrophomonas maltophilia TaxID=40324 RepID=UPI00209702CC|nr:rhodopsin [Stenotrophomonas maltophilia]MCO7399910.1 rhodopsin [Stenotrophomonas maltophilia]MCO7410323.1 rhodopsin [Stenotrophomonas maltophilia]